MLSRWLNSFMSQNWEDLLLLHWPIPAESLAPTIPADLEIDLHEGQAWASVVGFKLTNLRISPLTWIPWSDFWEVNLRTYVKDRNGRKGVWFHSLDSSDPLAMVGARLLYGLSYHFARIHQSRTENHLSYQSNRYGIGKSVPAYFQAEIPPESENAKKADSPLDRFLLERYRFWADRAFESSSSSARVMHPAYDAVKLVGCSYEGELFRSQGMEEPGGSPFLAHYCRGFPVQASAPSWAFGIAGQANQR